MTQTEGICIDKIGRTIPYRNNIQWSKKHNWIIKIDTMQNHLYSCRFRRITLLGQITIVKCLALSKMICTASLTQIPDVIEQNMN